MYISEREKKLVAKGVYIIVNGQRQRVNQGVNQTGETKLADQTKDKKMMIVKKEQIKENLKKKEDAVFINFQENRRKRLDEICCDINMAGEYPYKIDETVGIMVDKDFNGRFHTLWKSYKDIIDKLADRQELYELDLEEKKKEEESIPLRKRRLDVRRELLKNWANAIEIRNQHGFNTPIKNETQSVIDLAASDNKVVTAENNSQESLELTSNHLDVNEENYPKKTVSEQVDKPVENEIVNDPNNDYSSWQRLTTDESSKWISNTSDYSDQDGKYGKMKKRISQRQKDIDNVKMEITKYLVGKNDDQELLF